MGKYQSHRVDGCGLTVTNRYSHRLLRGGIVRVFAIIDDLDENVSVAKSIMSTSTYFCVNIDLVVREVFAKILIYDSITGCRLNDGARFCRIAFLSL